VDTAVDEVVAAPGARVLRRDREAARGEQQHELELARAQVRCVEARQALRAGLDPAQQVAREDLLVGRLERRARRSQRCSGLPRTTGPEA